MAHMSEGKLLQRAAALAARTVLISLVISAAACAGADTIYGTSIEGSLLFKADTSTATVTTVLNTLSGADSLIFDSSGRIIYSQLYSGTVRRYDPMTSSDVVLASGLNTPVDLALEPGGGSVLVSEFWGGNIDRIDLNTLVTTTLATGLINPEGIAYDGTGRLFANVGNRYAGPTGKQLVQLDPVTGAVLASTPGLDSLDGLTYDPFTNRLYASALFANGFYGIDPNNLAAAPLLLAWGGIPMPDGITTNGTGKLFIAARGDFNIYEYDLTSAALTPAVYVYGLDDLAPASGLGSHPDVPEPGSLAVLAGALLGGATVAIRRRQR